MRLAIRFCLVAALVGCAPDVGELVPSTGATNSALTPEVLDRGTGEPLSIATKPDLQPGNILSEKLNWSRVDMSIKLNVTIDHSGVVMTSSLASVFPPDSELAREIGEFVAERFEAAVFEAPSRFSYPHSFEVTVNFPSPRDASGRFK